MRSDRGICRLWAEAQVPAPRARASASSRKRPRTHCGRGGQSDRRQLRANVCAPDPRAVLDIYQAWYGHMSAYNGLMSPLALLAEQVGVNERTLRRAVNEGTLRATRPSPRKLEVPIAELRYVRRSWSLIATLREALRTEPNVRFALLFGSAARGTDTPTSDLDLLVRLRDSSLDRTIDLATKLADITGRRVDVVRLEDAEAQPAFLADVVGHGRVLIDRDGSGLRLRKRRVSLNRRARAQRPDQLQTALASREPRKADRARWSGSIIDHLQDFPRQYAALETAMAAFGDDFDLRAFKLTFETSEDLEAYNRVQAVERAVLRVQNYVGELAENGAKLAELPGSTGPGEQSEIERALATLRDADVIDGNLCRRLVRAQGARRRIEHSYVRVRAGDVHRATQLIHEAARDFIARYRQWIEPYLADGDEIDSRP